MTQALASGLAHGLVHRVEDGQAQMGGAAFAGRDAADHFRAVGNGLLGMETCLARR